MGWILDSLTQDPSLRRLEWAYSGRTLSHVRIKSQSWPQTTLLAHCKADM